MAGAGTINVNLVARTAEFMAGMKSAAGSIVSLESTVNRVQALVVGFLGVQALRSVVNYTHGIMESIDATAKFADRIGVATEFLTSMQHAADLSGISNETLSAGMQKMVKNASDAANGNKALAESFAELHINAKDFANVSPQDQFLQLADALSQVQNSGDRTRLTMDIFGKSGAELLPMMDAGAKGLREMQQEAEALGLTFSRLDAAKVEQANDAMTRLGAGFKGAFQQIAIEVSPAIEAIAGTFLSSARAAGGFGKIAGEVMDFVRVKIGVVGDAWNVLSAAWAAGRVAINMTAYAWIESANGIVKAISYMAGLWGNFTRFLGDSMRVIAATFGWLWAKAKQPIAEFVQFGGVQLSNLLHQAAAATARVNAELSKSLLDSAGAIASGTGDAAAQAEIAANRAGQAMTLAAESAGLSWKYMFRVNTSGSDSLAAMAEGYRAAGEQAAVDYSAAFSSVLNKDASVGVADWFSQIDAMSAANAQAAADRAAARLATNQEMYAAEAAEAEAHEKRLTDLRKAEANRQMAWDKQTQSQRLDLAAGVLGNLATLQNTHSRRAFAIGKAAAMAQAVVSTASGIARAFGELPFWVAIPAAAAIAVAGGVQISTIASTQFGGGGSVSSAGGSVALAHGEPVGLSQSAQPGVTGNAQRTLQITFTGLSSNALLNGEQVRQLIDQINDAGSDGSPVNVNLGNAA